MKTQTTNYKTIRLITYWVIVCWFRRIPSSQLHAQTWLNQVEAWEMTNGPIYTIRQIKMIRQLVMSYLSGTPQIEVKQIIGINRSNGLPKSITYLHKLIESRDPNNLRFVFTLLSISRVISGWNSPNLETITKPSSPDMKVILELEEYMNTFLAQNNWVSNQLTYFDEKEMLFSSKSGPNGAATRTSLFDLVNLPKALLEVLKKTNISELVSKYEGLLSPERVRFYHAVQQNWSKYNLIRRTDKSVSPSWFDQFKTSPIKGYSRKLSIVKDPEAKSRIIAIFDFWSQTWLRQIHKIHFNFLRKLPTDRTFTQDPFISNKPEGHKYYSFDLSAATDRFPRDLQRRLIEKMFGSETAYQWEHILTAHDFYVPWEDRFIKYEVGQPMGAYSSWTTFTICHHVVLQYIHFKLKLNNFYYQILGDDIVIYHDEVAKEYQHIMKSLDVEISIPKSCISSNMHEFAKRIFISGKEITGIQLRGFVEGYKHYHLIYQMIYDLVYNRGYITVDNITIPEIVYLLMKITKMKEKQSLNIKSRVVLLHAFNKFLLGDGNPLIDRIKALYPSYEGQLQLPEIELNNWTYMALDETLRQINAEYIKYAENIINKPEHIEQAAIGLASWTDINTSPIYYLTKLPVIEALRNNILAQSRARNLDSLKEITKAIALPTSDIFDKRNSIKLTSTYAKLAKKFLVKFEHYVISGRLAPMPDPNLGTQVLDHISSTMRDYQIDKSHGLFPPSPKPKVVPVLPDPYASGVAMW